MIPELKKKAGTFLLKDPQAPSFCPVKNVFDNEDEYEAMVEYY